MGKARFYPDCAVAQAEPLPEVAETAQNRMPSGARASAAASQAPREDCGNCRFMPAMWEAVDGRGRTGNVAGAK